MFSLPTGAAKKEKRSVVRLETSAGNIRIALSDLTPIHRDNFLTLVQQGYYDGLLFHRVIEDFMIQTGDPDSRNAPKDSLLGNGGPGYTLAAEIVFPDLFHLRGSVAAAREGDDVNPEFRSSGSQFYIVWGQKLRPANMKKALSYLEERGIELDRCTLSDYQIYGGSPHLDGTYTVFGEVIEGLDVVETIQACPTDSNDRPLEDVVILCAKIERVSKAAYSTGR
ncbi:MAG: peptidylprolyl isomerase [Bacteroidaceae bacterium]|jgi:peptidyl-prolyl cis-trans isomerase B (cyclophilin B)|nr:peptidylprolyl isomerase [Bacteroidaceae bacterium]